MTGTAENGWLLSIERHIAAPPQTVWNILKNRMEEFWCPKPWRAEIVEQDWRPGGRSAMVMHGPDGEYHPMEGIFLEVEEGRRFTFTDAMTSEFMPKPAFMIGTIEILPDQDGTLYRGYCRHWTEEAMKRHEEMGFFEGWKIVADQLATLAEGEV